MLFRGSNRDGVSWCLRQRQLVVVRQLLEEEGVSERTQFVDMCKRKTLNLKEVKT